MHISQEKRELIRLNVIKIKSQKYTKFKSFILSKEKKKKNYLTEQIKVLHISLM